MYPTLALIQPKIAASLLQYRRARLQGAYEKARTYQNGSFPGYYGAMFPWESGFTGVEVCPSWAATGQKEIHITGDIALAVWQYHRLTNGTE